jgi:hypothetical protein
VVALCWTWLCSTQWKGLTHDGCETLFTTLKLEALFTIISFRVPKSQVRTGIDFRNPLTLVLKIALFFGSNGRSQNTPDSIVIHLLNHLLPENIREHLSSLVSLTSGSKTSLK